MVLKKYFWNSSMPIFSYLLHKSDRNPKFSNKSNHLPAWRDFKIFFSRPVFTIIFWPKMIFLVTNSILRVKTMVVLQPYSFHNIFTKINSLIQFLISACWKNRYFGRDSIGLQTIFGIVSLLFCLLDQI